MKRVLLISAAFPPQLGGPSEKMAKRVKYFSRFGWQTTVLAPAIPAGSTLDESLCNEIGDVEVHRIQYLFQARWPSLRHDKDRQQDFSGSKFERFLDVSFVPKGFVRWLPYAVQAGRQLAASADVILTMNNPISLHIIGYIIKKLTGKPWVAEIRDPIVEYAYGRRGPEKLNYWLERLVVKNANVVIQREDFTPDIISLRYPKSPPSKFVVIPYTGFDPDDFSSQTTDEVKVLSNDQMVISYTGSFYGDTITPIPFLNGLKRCLSTNAISAQAIRVIFAGDWDDQFDQLIEELDLQDIVSYRGRITRQQCIELWHKSHVLLLILGKEADNILRIPSKFWDYLGAKRPILSLVAPNGRLANLVVEQNLGVVADPEDEEAIATAINQLFVAFQEKRLKAQPTPEFLSLANRACSEKTIIDVFNQIVQGA